MSNKHRLKGRRIGVLAADGFEKVELTVPVKALRGAGAKVDIISLRHGRIRGLNLHEPATTVRVTMTVQEANPQDYDGVLIPGGFINPDLLRQSAAARAFVRTFMATGRPVASLCHGPWLLASAGVLQDTTLTSWPGIRDDLVNAGATWLDQDVVHDGNLVTSRGPQDLGPFVRAITDHFAGGLAGARPASPPVVSAPPRDEPPTVVLRALKWTPRPSLRTLLGVGVLMAIVAARRRTHA